MHRQACREIDITGVIPTRVGTGIGWREAAESSGPAFQIRFRLTRADLVHVTPKLQAVGHVQRTRHTDVEVAIHIQRSGPLRREHVAVVIIQRRGNAGRVVQIDVGGIQSIDLVTILAP